MGRESLENRGVLVMERITKIYGNGFAANKNVTFAIGKGEIHGLVGENGAGKTTLMKVLFGLEKPDEGRILLEGREIQIENPLKALDYGIGMVHQHFMLVGSLSVAENMVLGMEPKQGLLFDYKEAVRLTNEIANRFKLPVDAKARVNDISVGQKQRVEILKILLRGAKILLLDEPTAVLTPQETKELFVRLKELKKEGYTIVFISHKLNEVKELCDRITVLRRGVVTGTASVSTMSEGDISKMIVGKDVDLNLVKKTAAPGQVALSVRDLCCQNGFGKMALNRVSFDLRQGEILGVAGVEGNGQSELSELLSGLLPISDGKVVMNGADISRKSIREIRLSGASLIHEDRMIYGVSGKQTLEENVLADRYFKEAYSKKGVIRRAVIHSEAKGLIEEYQIACDGSGAAIDTLSGGNIQKVVAAREFSAKPRILIASQPTRGIDVGAAELIRRQLIRLRDEYQTAILLFSADLTELLTVSDSILVIYNGELAAYFPEAGAADEGILGEYMLGLKKQTAKGIGGVLYENAG